ncbi:hypothetical protein Bbelb_022430 [Branchiostoma belcheri]|nr:hypothetical protein Bbelb_022430 [Branchiostoma belcheri]
MEVLGLGEPYPTHVKEPAALIEKILLEIGIISHLRIGQFLNTPSKPGNVQRNVVVPRRVGGVAERDKIVPAHLSDMLGRRGTAYGNQEGRAAPSQSINAWYDPPLEYYAFHSNCEVITDDINITV